MSNETVPKDWTPYTARALTSSVKVVNVASAATWHERAEKAEAEGITLLVENQRLKTALVFCAVPLEMLRIAEVDRSGLTCITDELYEAVVLATETAREALAESEAGNAQSNPPIQE